MCEGGALEFKLTPHFPHIQLILSTFMKANGKEKRLESSLNKRRFKTAFAALLIMVLFNVLHSSSRVSNVDIDRELSISYGNGECKWQPPAYDVPEYINFYKTMVVGYPSGDKRLTFIQMEALTGWPAKDEWDFKYLGYSNHPFIKANYPHHEGMTDLI